MGRSTARPVSPTESTDLAEVCLYTSSSTSQEGQKERLQVFLSAYSLLHLVVRDRHRRCFNHIHYPGPSSCQHRLSFLGRLR